MAHTAVLSAVSTGSGWLGHVPTAQHVVDAPRLGVHYQLHWHLPIAGCHWPALQQLSTLSADWVSLIQFPIILVNGL